MTHAKQKVHSTYLVSEESKPLAVAVWAIRGSRSATVLLKISQIIETRKNKDELPERLLIPLHTVTDPKTIEKGLILNDGQVHGKSSTFSTRYRYNPEREQYILTIGTKLPDSRLYQVANEIIAMIKRGICTWRVTDKSTGLIRECKSAYGIVPIKKIKSDEWRKHRDLQRRKRKLSGSTL